jgi:hypothetical protein
LVVKETITKLKMPRNGKKMSKSEKRAQSAIEEAAWIAQECKPKPTAEEIFAASLAAEKAAAKQARFEAWKEEKLEKKRRRQATTGKFGGKGTKAAFDSN